MENNKLLIYNYSVDKWSTGSGQDLEFIAGASQEAFNTLESLDVLGNLDNLPRSLDSYYYGEGIVGLAGFNSSHLFGKFIALRSTSRYHRVRVSVNGNFKTMSGVEIEARPEGKR